MKNIYLCQKCGSELEHTKKLILTSYPINRIFECSNCKIEYYLLIDKILCPKNDYNNRIKNYYIGD